MLDHPFLIQAISRRARGEEKAVRRIKQYLDFLVDNVCENTSSDLLETIGKHFRVATTTEPEEDEEPTAPGSRIPIYVKNSMFIEQELNKAEKCELCKARIPARGLSLDHRLDRKHGGSGTRENAARTHHACNSAKDKIKKLTSKSV